MTKIRLPYIHEFRDRHGHVRYYFRRHGKRVPLPGPVGSEQFMSAYQAALANAEPQQIGANRTKPGSVNAAYTSLDFRSLAAGTQALRRAIYERFRVEHGVKSIGAMPGKFIAATLSKMQPHAARNWLKALRALCQFCVAQEFITADPTLGIKLPRVKSDGHHTWTEAEIAQFEATHPIGSKARLALALLLYTGQRGSDVTRMGRQHISNNTISVRQQKTKTPLRIPIHPALQTVLEWERSAHLTFLVNGSGRPYKPAGFTNQFRTWCNEAGLPPECVPHGLRKAACRRLAEAGCSANEIAAISGHKSLREVERYVKEADQERMARNAMARVLAGDSRTDGAHTSGNPGRPEVATPLK